MSNSPGIALTALKFNNQYAVNTPFLTLFEWKEKVGLRAVSLLQKEHRVNPCLRYLRWAADVISFEILICNWDWILLLRPTATQATQPLPRLQWWQPRHPWRLRHFHRCKKHRHGAQPLKIGRFCCPSGSEFTPVIALRWQYLRVASLWALCCLKWATSRWTKLHLYATGYDNN